MKNKKEMIIPILETRKDLAHFLDIPYKRLTYILYKLDRGSAYHEFEISKSSGKTRVLHAVHGPLKSLQRRALEKLQVYWMPSAYAHGFVVGRSIITNAVLHRRKKRIIKVDIKDFFPSISFARVQGMFQAPPFQFSKEVAVTLAQLACLDDIGGILPQGGVLSPYIANMICRRLDSRMARLAHGNHCRLTRYADDITFSTNDVSRLDEETLVGKIYEIIESEHFTPNRAKTRILTPKDRQIITGIVVNDGLNVNRKYLRNVRATLKNCESSSLESQVVKPHGFMDQRNSRMKIKRHGDGFILGNIPISVDDACKQFLWHLFGKICFIGQVVQANGQDLDPHTYRRIFAYEQLLLRFHKLVERDPRFFEIRKSAYQRIKKHPNILAKLSLQYKQDDILRDVRNEHRNNPKTMAAIVRVEEVQNIKTLRKLLDEFSVRDPRFFRIALPDSLSDARDTVIKKLLYPAINRQKTFVMLQSLRDSQEGLGVLTHETDEFCGEVAFKLLAKHYTPVLYNTPFALRKLFEQYMKSLKTIVIENGPNHSIDVLNDPVLAKATSILKKGTRFGGVPEDTSSLKEVVMRTINYARKRVERPIIEIPKPQIQKTGFYTHVESIEKALNLIMHSMLKNTPGTRITIQTSIDSDGENIFEISVVDDSNAVIQAVASRDFVNGKLARVVRETDGLCDYWVETEFSVDGRVCIDMHTGNLISEQQTFGAGFAHRLRFKLRLD